MNFTDAATIAFNFISGMGITHIVDTAVANLVPKSPSKFTNACTHVGCFVIGTMLSDAACEYVNKTVKEIQENVRITIEPVTKETEYIDKETESTNEEN